MSVSLKPLSDQVVFITGASSGIGLVTARRAAEAGAKVFLVARNDEALKSAVEQIKSAGGQAGYAVADVADIEQFKAAADSAVNAFGTIDTWVNNAGVGMFTDITKNTEQDDRKLFDTNFWGIVNGSRLAVQYLRDGGGALINLGSEVSDVAVPVQGIYSASKHAVLGFTDAFRMELNKAGVPISVTVIKPAAIDTPFTKHAKNNTDKATTLPAPVYAPGLVADQILHAAVHPTRELFVGGGGRVMVLLREHFPTVADWVIGKTMPGQQLKDEPADHGNEGLYETAGGHAERGGLSEDRHVHERSVYGVVSRHPYATTFITAAASAAAAYFFLRPRQPDPTRAERWKKAFGDRTAGPLAEARDAWRKYAAQPIARARDAAGDYAADAVDRVKHQAHDTAESARGFRDQAYDRAADAAEAVNERAHAWRESATDYAGDASERLRDAANEYVLTPAERFVGAVRKKVEEFLG